MKHDETVCGVHSCSLVCCESRCATRGIQGPSAAPASTSDAPVETEEQVSDEEIQARSDLREVRHVLNEFRDNRWEAIERVRNQFVCTMILTGLTMYVLLQFAILAGA